MNFSYRTIIILILLGLFSIGLYSQNQQNDVYKQIDRENLLFLKNNFQNEFEEREQRIGKYLDENPEIRRVIINGFSVKEIYDVLDSGEIYYLETSNFNSSVTIRTDRLYNGGSLG